MLTGVHPTLSMYRNNKSNRTKTKNNIFCGTWISAFYFLVGSQVTIGNLVESEQQWQVLFKTICKR